MRVVLEYPPHFCVDLDDERMRRVLDVGKVRFVQEHFGVSPGHYALWERHLQYGGRVCSGLNRSGDPCGSHMHPFFGPPSLFVLGIDDRCEHHQAPGESPIRGRFGRK